ncbi:hypothetical protein AK812_SmicGene16164 [Symbiodinium microadriaticum]|uniref:Uncharacterized protein n=2 Tax=Symbiodinium microadriaticum TaxID=2951 RepID=A0A1Q9E148_SYMMI|nr:hypothetical protein AK812_SmicGene16164 [Symbiodinium microadriaticum]
MGGAVPHIAPPQRLGRDERKHLIQQGHYELSAQDLVRMSAAAGHDLSVHSQVGCTGNTSCGNHVYLTTGGPDMRVHFQAVRLEENAPCRADAADVLRSLRGYLTARQWSGRAVGEAELQASARTYMAARAVKHSIVETLEASGALSRLVSVVHSTYVKIARAMTYDHDFEEEFEAEEAEEASEAPPAAARLEDPLPEESQEEGDEEAGRSTTYDDDVFEEEDHEDSRHEEDD